LYDPGREADMLAYLAAENPGPFSSETICHLFKEIFKASLDLKERQTAARCLYSRHAKPQDTKVVAGPVTFGTAPLLIAGPCSIESAEQITDTARFLSSRGVRVLRGGAYKPRTSPYGFQGLGEPALRIGRAAADAHLMAFVTEVVDTRDVAVVAESAHMLQVGARNAQNFALLREVPELAQWFTVGDKVRVEGRAVTIELSPDYGATTLDAATLAALVKDWQ
jgi:3-deoxy-7-phosphoheptulonate synthase/chorismate mutase